MYLTICLGTHVASYYSQNDGGGGEQQDAGAVEDRKRPTHQPRS